MIIGDRGGVLKTTLRLDGLLLTDEAAVESAALDGPAAWYWG